jgi:anti-sigma factor RsiW
MNDPMKDIVCLSGVELLMEYLEGTLAPDTRDAIDAHVAGCPRCVAFIDSYVKAPRILRDATAAAMPADLEASLLAALRARRERADGSDPQG